MPRINALTIQEHRQLTHRALFTAAHDLFGRLGYAGTTLGDIADHAGIGRTTFYDYFTDKDDLLASLVEESLPQVFQQMIGEIPRTLSSREQLSALAVAMVEFVVADPVFGLILHQDVPRLKPEAQRRIAATHQDLITEFARIYGEGVRGGEFREMPFDLAGHFIIDVVMSGARTMLKSDEPKQRFHEVAEETVTFLLGGLGRP
ncbi:MAG: TetR/AcrR family transcriptional regulator [Acidimicrobiia bacterium]|nr:TetR/AcrR family transcriptional regulator [Acidimicrobiia bacterium]